MKPEYDSRDYADLRNPEIAVYNFRGYTVFRFKKKEKQLEFGEEANMCHFIKDDYELMARFLTACFDFCNGKIDKIENVEVN